jgi:predicted O-methyltransferase YrrM
MGEYKFDPKFDWWTKDHYANYAWIREHFLSTTSPGTSLRFVEIGVFEGRSTVWFVENVLKAFPGSSYICVEPDPAPNFAHNIRLLKDRCPDVNIIHEPRYSEHFLPDSISFLNNSHEDRYDLGYVDGDHNAQGVLRDNVMVWECLKVGGIQLMDDYEMEATDPWHYISHKEFKEHDRAKFRHPSIAIDAFLNVYHGLYEKVIDNFQVGVIKRVDLGAKNLGHGDGTQGGFEYHAKGA